MALLVPLLKGRLLEKKTNMMKNKRFSLLIYDFKLYIKDLYADYMGAVTIRR